MAADQFDTIFADAVAVLTEIHAGDVTRWPHGHEGESETVTAMWTPEETGDRDADPQSQRIVFEGKLHVRETQAVDKDDAWVIDSWRYQTVALGHIESGLRSIKVKRVDKITTSRTPNVR